jgi:hypothetical protein
MVAQFDLSAFRFCSVHVMNGLIRNLLLLKGMADKPMMLGVMEIHLNQQIHCVLTMEDIYYDQLCAPSLNKDVIMCDVQNMVEMKDVLV